MLKTSLEQRKAMKRLYDRTPLYRNIDNQLTSRGSDGSIHNYGPISYLEFRRSFSVGYDCLMVHWCGMWIGIEQDGYTHS